MLSKGIFTVVFAVLTVVSLILSLGGSPFYIMMTVIDASAFLTCVLSPKGICIIPMLIGTATMIYMLVSMIHLALAW